MGTNRKSWEISDEFWDKVKNHIPPKERIAGKEYKRKPGGGRKPADPKTVLSAIFYVLRTGIQWKALPKGEFGSSSAVHRYFIYWSEEGFFEKIWSLGLMEYDELERIGWEWQSIDGCMIKSPLGQESVGANPTDRGKKWIEAAYPHRRERHAPCGGSDGSKQA